MFKRTKYQYLLRIFQINVAVQPDGGVHEVGQQGKRCDSIVNSNTWQSDARNSFLFYHTNERHYCKSSRQREGIFPLPGILGTLAYNIVLRLKYCANVL